MRAVIYVRLSSKNDPTSTSLDDQERECRALAARRGLEVVEVYREREGTSAFRRGVARPEFDRMMRELKPDTTVLAWELSRITRRGAEHAGPLLAHLDELGASLVTVADGIDTTRDDGELNWAVRAAIAREESIKTSQRTRRALESRRRAGLHHGRAPYGFRKINGRLEVDPETAAAAKAIVDRALAGESVYAIVKDLNAAGGNWAHSTVRRWLRSPSLAGYAGVRTRLRGGRYADRIELYLDENGEPVQIGEGLVTLDEWRTLQRRLDARTRATATRSTGRRAPVALLTGFLECAQCGGPMCATGGRAEDGPKLYGCQRRMKRVTGCEHAYVSRLHADWTVVGAFIGGLAALTPGDPLHSAVAEAWTRRQRPDAVARAEAARERLAATEEALERLDDDRADGLIDRDAYVRQRRRLMERQEAAAREVRGIEPGEVDISPLLQPELMREAWNAASMVSRRDYLALAIERVRIHPATRRGRFDPRRVEIVWRS